MILTTYEEVHGTEIDGLVIEGNIDPLGALRDDPDLIVDTEAPGPRFRIGLARTAPHHQIDIHLDKQQQQEEIVVNGPVVLVDQGGVNIERYREPIA